MDGLLVVERAYRFQRKTVGEEEIVARYRGIEGSPWPDDPRKKFKVSCGVAIPEQLSEILDYYQAVSRKRKCDLLFIQTHEIQKRTDTPPPGFAFCGYDLGNYISEYNLFSVIFNEVLFGKHDELRRFSSYLNANLLFDKKDDVEKLKAVRERLAQDGADLETIETDEDFCEIGVYNFSDKR
jgi:hypothetical protein